MQTNQLAKTPAYNESDEEAKHPGAVLGLIMGIYPAIFIGVLLIGIAALGFRSTFPSSFPKSQPADSETSTQPSSSTKFIKQENVAPE